MSKQLVLQLRGSHVMIAAWIAFLTKQMNQIYSGEKLLPFTNGVDDLASEEYDFPFPKEVQVGAATPEDIEDVHRYWDYPGVWDSQLIMSFRTAQLTPSYITMVIDYLEDREADVPWMPELLKAYLREIAKVWPDCHDALQEQLVAFDGIEMRDILPSSATDASLATPTDIHYLREPIGNVSEEAGSLENLFVDTFHSRANFTRERRHRADLFKELKRNNPDWSQQKLALEAQHTARERIKEQIEDANRAWSIQQVKEAVDEVMKEEYGDVKWNRAAVENDWRAMKEAGEVCDYKEYDASWEAKHPS